MTSGIGTIACASRVDLQQQNLFSALASAEELGALSKEATMSLSQAGAA